MRDTVPIGRTHLTKNGSSPIAAESEVDYNLLAVKERSRAVSSEGEDGGRFSPCGGVGVVGTDVGGDDIVPPEKDLDTACVPECCVDTTASVVEVDTVCSGVGVDSGATLVVKLTGGFHVAVGGTGLSPHVSLHARHRAACFGVKRNLIAFLVVDAFEDVDFAVVGPVGSNTRIH